MERCHRAKGRISGESGAGLPFAWRKGPRRPFPARFPGPDAERASGRRSGYNPRPGCRARGTLRPACRPGDRSTPVCATAPPPARQRHTLRSHLASGR